jgi:hypothetical protein
MNPVFAAKLKPAEIDDNGRVRTFALASSPGTIPPTVNPPQAADAPQHNAGSGPDVPSGATKIFGDVTSTVSKWVGLGSSEPPAPPPTAAPAAAAPAPKPKTNPVVHTAATPAAVLTRPRVQQQPAQATSVAPTQAVQTQAPQAPAPAADQQIANVQPAAPAPAPAPTGGSSVMLGAQPLLPASSFDSRWGGAR